MLFKFVITLMSSLEFLFFFDSSSYGLDTPCSHLSMFGNTTKAAQPKIIRTTVVDASPTQSMFLITSNAPYNKRHFLHWGNLHKARHLLASTRISFFQPGM